MSLVQPPATYQALRRALADLPDPGRLPWLVDFLAEAASAAAAAGKRGVPNAWRLAQSLATSHPDLLRNACEALLTPGAGPARHFAIDTLARLHNRQEDFAALRALLERFAEAPPRQAKVARRKLLLRSLLLDQALDQASRQALWAQHAAVLSPLGRASGAVQLALADGIRPDPAALLAEVEAAIASGPALPAPLARLAAARDVALVGNGSGLARAGAAALIEAHDAVVRFNFPHLAGFEADVGRRTDLVLFAEAKRWNLEALRQRDKSYDGLPAFGTRITWPRDPAVEAEADQVPRPLAEAVAALGDEHPTTGFFGILMVAVLLRRKVTLFGFDFFAPGLPGHYYGDATAAMTHELAYERWCVGHLLPLLAPELRRHG